MFANTQMGRVCMGFPDVCNTPTPGGPVPVPYPNVAAGPTSVGFVPNVLWMSTPAHNLATEVPMTNGDNAGVGMGVASGVVMGPSRAMTGAFTVLVGGMPAMRMTSVTIQNSTNCPGVSAVPSQIRVLLLAP